MELLKSIKIDCLDFGEYDAKDEFKPENFKKTNQIFYDVVNFNYNDILSKKKTFVYGHKGTGKTSILRYLESILIEKKENYVFILFKTIKRKPGIYENMKKLLLSVDEDDRDIAAQRFWEWLILSYAHSIDFNDLADTIFETKTSFFGQLGKILGKIGLGAEFKGSLLGGTFEAKISANHQAGSGSDYFKEIEEATSKIIKLSEKINKNASKKIFVLIDELELSSISKTWEMDSILIKNLIIAADTLNEEIENINILTAIRSEVLESSIFAGEEINKIVKGKGIHVSWQSNDFNIKHPLLEMIIKKIKYSVKDKLPANQALELDTATNEEIFNHFFSTPLQHASKTKNLSENPKYILNATWLRPRGIVILFNKLKSDATGKYHFSQENYDMAIKAYSSDIWDEIKEELSTNYNADEIDRIQSLFNTFFKVFTADEFIVRCHEYLTMDASKIYALLDVLFDIGMIGNNYFENGDEKFRFRFRGDIKLDRTKSIMVHRALWKYFDLKDNDKSVKHSTHEPMANIRFIEKQK